MYLFIAKINPVAIYLRIFVLSIMQVCFANMADSSQPDSMCLAAPAGIR